MSRKIVKCEGNKCEFYLKGYVIHSLAPLVIVVPNRCNIRNTAIPIKYMKAKKITCPLRDPNADMSYQSDIYGTVITIPKIVREEMESLHPKDEDGDGDAT